MCKPRLPFAVLLMLFASTALAAGAASAPDTSGNTQGLATVLSNLTGVLGTYVAVLAGTSGLALALLEAFKKLCTIRGRFHRTAIIRWLSQDTDSIPPMLRSEGADMMSLLSLGGSEHYKVRAERKVTTVAAPPAAGATPPGPGAAYDPAVAYSELFHLTSGQKLLPKPKPRDELLRWRGIDRAVFELETARMMSQVQDAADAVLNNPKQYPHLYAFLTRGADAADVAKWSEFISNPPTTTPGGPTKEQSDRYGRIRLLMRRQLDAFQGVTSNRWTELNQLWAVIVGAVLLFMALSMAADPKYVENAASYPLTSLMNGLAEAWKKGAIGAIVLKSMLGGALAPIAKDLLTSLSSLKFTK
jgi:hypothetical protein